MPEFKMAWNYFCEEHEKRDFIMTGNKDIDKLIGGIAYGTITEISGESGCGKSQFCMQLTACLLANKKKVFYIDTEKGSSLKRIEQLIEKYSQQRNISRTYDINLLTLSESLSIQHLIITLEQLLQSDNSPDILFLDSIAAPFRGEDLRERAIDIDAVAVTLCRLATELRIAVICVNHVTSDFSGGGTKPSLGAYWSHRPTSRIWMERKENKRIMKLDKSPFAPSNKCDFIIKDDGIHLVNTEMLYI